MLCPCLYAFILTTAVHAGPTSDFQQLHLFAWGLFCRPVGHLAAHEPVLPGSSLSNDWRAPSPARVGKSKERVYMGFETSPVGLSPVAQSGNWLETFHLFPISSSLYHFPIPFKLFAFEFFSQHMLLREPTLSTSQCQNQIYEVEFPFRWSTRRDSQPCCWAGQDKWKTRKQSDGISLQNSCNMRGKSTQFGNEMAHSQWLSWPMNSATVHCILDK